jgi:hypothetical protein
MIRRYRFCEYEEPMYSFEEDEDGEWVLWEDVKDLVVAPVNTVQQAQPAICRNALVQWSVCRCSIDKRECNGKGEWTEHAPLGLQYGHQCERYSKRQA